MNKRPPYSSSPAGSISSFRKRRQQGGRKNIILIAAGILVLGGVILLVAWLAGPSKPINAFFATETPTPTLTYTPTNTSTPTSTSTMTETPTITPTATFSTPYNYIVEEGDSLTLIVEKQKLGEDGIQLILFLNPFAGISESTGYPIGIDPATQNILPGQVILLPNPGMELPTSTPIPEGLTKGTKIEYTVQPGDSLGAIAQLFNSTIEDIIAENKLSDPNSIKVGDLLIIPVNMVTPTATRPPTSTPAGDAATATWTPVNFIMPTSTP